MLFDNPTLPAPFNRVAILEAFLERPVWTTKSVRTASSILSKDYWWIEDECYPIIERLTEELKLWKHLERLVPETGSLRLALVRPSRKERVERAINRVYRHIDWRRSKLRTEIKYKPYKTRSAFMKQKAKLDAAIANDAVLQRCSRLLKTLNNQRSS